MIPSEDEFVKKIPHVSQVHIYIYIFVSVCLFFTQSYGTITFYDFTRKNIYVTVAMVFIYTNDEEVRILNRPTIK